MGSDMTSEQQDILDAIREVAEALGRPPSRREFLQSSALTEYRILKYFSSWREAVRAAGLTPDSTNRPLSPGVLLEDWGQLVRRFRRIPTRNQYRRDGTFSVGAFERKFGPWSGIPDRFREFASTRPEWSDVVALLPAKASPVSSEIAASADADGESAAPSPALRYAKLDGRATYGNPIDFRGLRHEPVNEGGVVFLFGMVARELGYYVEAIQAGFPDCEAKRQVSPNKWQRVRIEFEYESRNFRDHGHSLDGCDIIVCWRHNWAECPPTLEVLELSRVIPELAASDE